ncbi:MAG: glycosyltransferase [candidate division KSB1 bacterium]|nr:glycosyltransferase [candidate division KSB1 bacterium]
MENEPLKLLHVDAGREWRGGQQQIAYLLKGLSERGYLQYMLCPVQSGLNDICREYSIPCYNALLRGEFDVRSMRTIALLSRFYGINVLHAHCAHSLALCQGSRFFYHKPRLIAARRVDFSVRKKVIGAWKYKNPRVDRIICVSKAIERILIRDGVPPDRLTTVYSGVDLQKFADSVPVRRAELDIPQHHFVIGTIAALADHKDYPNLMHAARLVLDQRRDITFLALGDGPEKTKLELLARDLDLGTQFKFMGHQTDVGSFLKAFDLFVLASKTEGLGTSILDAQAAGLPVVATRAGGIPELIQHHRSGLLVRPRQPFELAEALLKLLNNKPLCEKIARQGKKHASRFDWRHMAGKTAEVYREVLDSGDY